MSSNASGGSSGNKGQNGDSRIRRWLRRALIIWWGLFVLLAGGLLTNILLLPLANGLDHWGEGVKSQVAALLALPKTQPFLAGIVVILVPGLTIALYVANLAIKREEQHKAEEEQRRITKEAANEQLDALAQKMAAAFQLPAQSREAPAKETPANVSAPSGLPRAVAFVGRGKTLDDLMARLRAGGNIGVFALAGMGGVGKTALAVEAVALLAAEAQTFPAGAAWVSCEGLAGADGLAELWTRVARAIGAEQVATLPDAETRRAALRNVLAQSQRLLLALDNIDGLEVGPILETLAIQGHTALLLTARKLTDAPGLTPIPLDILPTPEAETLFAQALARSSTREPRPTPVDQLALPGLVAALGGLPLAIELTASYAGRLGLMLATVQQEIEHDGVQAAPFIPSQNKEQRTLVLRFDRSWQALAETPRWQRLFAALSLLEGTSFPRDAELALATAAAKRGNASDASASPAGDLAALVDYALVESLGGERFRLHPLLRDYAAHRFATLESALQEQLGEAMLAFWLKYALAHPGFEGMSALEAEAAGLIGTLAWAHNHARYRELLVLTDAIHEAWWVRGRREEELRIYTWAVQAANMLGDLERQRWATHLQAETQRRMGRVEEARAGYERALEIARQMKRLKDERSELHGLAVLDRLAGRLEEARAGYERALAIARHLHDKTAEQREVYALAMLDDTMGRMVEAGGAYMEALEIARQLGDQPAEAGTLRLFGLFLCKHGQVVQGRMMIEHSLEINERLSAIYYIGKCHEFLGWVDVQVGNNAEAISHYQEALQRLVHVLSPEAENVRVHLRKLGK